MRFEVKFTRSADGDLDHYTPHEQKMIVDAVSRFLEVDAHVETRRRKRLRPNPLAPWELRLGRYRVFYEVRQETLVRVLAIGHKVHNDMFVRGAKVQL